MRLTRLELLEKIRLGEDSFLELQEVYFAGGKVRGPTQDDIADELAAFANGAGGVLLLGAEDSGRSVVGIAIDKLDAVEALLRQACEDSIKPPLAPIIERLTLPDANGAERPVIRVDVPRSLFVHLSPGGYLHRVGSSKRPIAPDQLARLFQQRSQSRLIRFDETWVPTATFADLNEALWRRFTGDLDGEAAEIVLAKLTMGGLDDEGVWRPSVAGVLMAAPDPRLFIPAAYIQAVTSLLAHCPVPPGLEVGRRSRIMDKRGEGVPIILRESRILSGVTPVFKMIDDSELSLTIYAANGEAKA